MALTNAERQRRWRERLKAKAALVEPERGLDVATLVDLWMSGVEDRQRQLDSAQAEIKELRRKLAAKPQQPLSAPLRDAGSGDELGEAQKAYLAVVARICTTRQTILLEQRRVTKSLDSMAKQAPEGKSIRL